MFQASKDYELDHSDAGGNTGAFTKSHQPDGDSDVIF